MEELMGPVWLRATRKRLGLTGVELGLAAGLVVEMPDHKHKHGRGCTHLSHIEKGDVGYCGTAGRSPIEGIAHALEAHGISRHETLYRFGYVTPELQELLLERYYGG